MAKRTKEERAKAMKEQKLARVKKTRQALQRKVRAKKRRQEKQEKADIALYGSIENAEVAKRKERIAKSAREEKKIGAGVLHPDSVRSAAGNISYATPKRKR